MTVLTVEGDISDPFTTEDSNDILLGSTEREIFDEQDTLLGSTEREIVDEQDTLLGSTSRFIFEDSSNTLGLHIGNHSAAVLKTPYQDQTFEDAGNIPFEYKIKNLENIDSSINLLLNDSVVETQSLSGEVTETFTSEHDADIANNTYSTEVTKDSTGETDASGQITFETLSITPAGSIFRTFNGVIETDNGAVQTQ